MPWGLTWLHCLGILLGVALGSEDLEVWPLTQNKECSVTGFLRDKLQYKNRLQYMKYYFPINYRISVPYEGVLRIANITKLRVQVSEQELRCLWVLVSLSAVESVQAVLLEGHPSWRYLGDVQKLLLNVQQGLVNVKISPRVEAVLLALNTPGLKLACRSRAQAAPALPSPDSPWLHWRVTHLPPGFGGACPFPPATPPPPSQALKDTHPVPPTCPTQSPCLGQLHFIRLIKYPPPQSSMALAPLQRWLKL
ncbi:interleukin-34 isoform X2 [Octodon degus]|uniref:Interleukin-34 isoform X2 n=1 Tax=Octodon degus TaxID=10160 RepID=A0A6P6DYE2_OCTDE|nr:interleukin-34 isoform X2 [Octodon degus]